MSSSPVAPVTYQHPPGTVSPAVTDPAAPLPPIHVPRLAEVPCPAPGTTGFLASPLTSAGHTSTPGIALPPAHFLPPPLTVSIPPPGVFFASPQPSAATSPRMPGPTYSPGTTGGFPAYSGAFAPGVIAHSMASPTMMIGPSPGAFPFTNTSETFFTPGTTQTFDGGNVVTNVRTYERVTNERVFSMGAPEPLMPGAMPPPFLSAAPVGMAGPMQPGMAAPAQWTATPLPTVGPAVDVSHAVVSGLSLISPTLPAYPSPCGPCAPGPMPPGLSLPAHGPCEVNPCGATPTPPSTSLPLPAAAASGPCGSPVLLPCRPAGEEMVTVTLPGTFSVSYVPVPGFEGSGSPLRMPLSSPHATVIPASGPQTLPLPSPTYVPAPPTTAPAVLAPTMSFGPSVAAQYMAPSYTQSGPPFLAPSTNPCGLPCAPLSPEFPRLGAGGPCTPPPAMSPPPPPAAAFPCGPGPFDLPPGLMTPPPMLAAGRVLQTPGTGVDVPPSRPITFSPMMPMYGGVPYMGGGAPVTMVPMNANMMPVTMPQLGPRPLYMAPSGALPGAMGHHVFAAGAPPPVGPAVPPLSHIPLPSPTQPGAVTGGGTGPSSSGAQSGSGHTEKFWSRDEQRASSAFKAEGDQFKDSGYAKPSIVREDYEHKSTYETETRSYSQPQPGPLLEDFQEAVFTDDSRWQGQREGEDLSALLRPRKPFPGSPVLGSASPKFAAGVIKVETVEEAEAVDSKDGIVDGKFFDTAIVIIGQGLYQPPPSRLGAKVTPFP